MPGRVLCESHREVGHHFCPQVVHCLVQRPAWLNAHSRIFRTREQTQLLHNWNNLLKDFDCPLLASIWEGLNMQRILTLQRQEESNARRFLMCGENQRWEGALLLRHKNKNPQGWAFIPLYLWFEAASQTYWAWSTSISSFFLSIHTFPVFQNPP